MRGITRILISINTNGWDLDNVEAFLSRLQDKLVGKKMIAATLSNSQEWEKYTQRLLPTLPVLPKFHPLFISHIKAHYALKGVSILSA